MAQFIGLVCDTIGCKNNAQGGFQVELTNFSGTRLRMDFCIECTLKRFAGTNMESSAVSINQSPVLIGMDKRKFTTRSLPRANREENKKFLLEPINYDGSPLLLEESTDYALQD